MPAEEVSGEPRDSFRERLLEVVRANTLDEREITSVRIAHAMWARQKRAYGEFLFKNLDGLLEILEG